MGKTLKFSQISPAGVTILVLLVAVLGVLISTGILKNKESFYSGIYKDLKAPVFNEGSCDWK